MADSWFPRALAALLVLCLFGSSSESSAETIFRGQTHGGAYFKIVVPDAWNGDLVIWNHGLELAPIAPDPDLGPLAQLQLSEGYAVAASTYSQIGWALFQTDRDLRRMYLRFVREFGRPHRVFVTGGSLGGLVTASAIENAYLGNVVGAMPVCGVLAGSRNWDLALDLRLSYDVVCRDVPGAALPGGARGLPRGSTFTPNDIGAAVHACTGVLAPPDQRTARQSENLARLPAETTLPESFLVRDMVFATIVMSDLVHDPGKLDGEIGIGNKGVQYLDPIIDAAIERVRPVRRAQWRLDRRFVPKGRVRDTKIVSMHTDKDGLAVVENESEYASVVRSSLLTTAIVVEDAPSHCGFTAAELAAGWESLRTWVGGAPKPTPSTIQTACQALEPALGGPCRIDPAFVVGDLDERIHPRPSRPRWLH